MSDSKAPRNLLFGLLALQMDFIERQQLILAMHQWTVNKSNSLGDLLVDQGAITPEQLTQLNDLLNQHISEHGGSPAASLASLGSIAGLLEDSLKNLNDQELDASVEQSHASISASLLQRVKKQDNEAWKRLTFLYSPIVKQWCQREGVASDDADDILQEVFRGVMNNIANFKRDQQRHTFRGWLWTVTRNKIVDHWRKKCGGVDAAGGTHVNALLHQIPGEVDDASMSQNDTSEKSGLVHRALQLIKVEFRENSWKAFWMTAIDGRDAADVAEELGMKVGAVYTAKSRVLSRLREEFADLEEDLLK